MFKSQSVCALSIKNAVASIILGGFPKPTPFCHIYFGHEKFQVMDIHTPLYYLNGYCAMGVD